MRFVHSSRPRARRPCGAQCGRVVGVQRIGQSIDEATAANRDPRVDESRPELVHELLIERREAALSGGSDSPHRAEGKSPAPRTADMIRNLTWGGLALIALITLLR
jgi:hypothetical protein